MDATSRKNAQAARDDYLIRTIRSNLEGVPRGVCSVCSANPAVLQAAMAQALSDGSPVLIESTSNQVNQFGGYTGMTAGGFARFIAEVASTAGFPPERVLLGGDHLGPYVWRSEPAQTAMAKASELIRSYVLAGFTKIHLDTSMRCQGDPSEQNGALPEEYVTRRAAELCRLAEQAYRELPPGSPAPLYVIGTEVPIPGGEQADSSAPEVTRPGDAERTLLMSRSAFHSLGLEEAWNRVIALVVQPGVEFGDGSVFPYVRSNARTLSSFIRNQKAIGFEAHSTDYQTEGALSEMVEDHFAILKVGPWLTFAYREAIYGLAGIEDELLQGPGATSQIRETLEQAMLEQPHDWKGYYQGEESYLRYARSYSYSDRVRYYWAKTPVQLALGRLLENLSRRPIPLPLISQFLPVQYEAVRRGEIGPTAGEMIDHKIRTVLKIYSRACFSGAG
jgi:D-tagatose-1,6-bisphosphate aldolase subunit GatZ/KbaZ